MAKRVIQCYLKAVFLRKYRGMVSIGKDCYVPFHNFRAHVSRLIIGDYVRLGARVFLEGDSFTFGDYFYCGSDVTIAGDRSTFEVGKFSSFGTRVSFLLGKGRHRPQSLSNVPFGHIPQFDSSEWLAQFDHETESATFCKVGHDVWIGVGSVILPNLTIGHGVIISAGSVVKQDVPPYAIVGGNPAQIISFRFKQSLIKELLELQWWDWPADKINRNVPFFTKNLTTLTSLKGVHIAP